MHSDSTPQPYQDPLATQTQISSQPIPSCSALGCIERENLLATALVTPYCSNAEKIIAQALLDNGSQTSFVTKQLVDKLNCGVRKRTMQFMTISHQLTKTHELADFEILSCTPEKFRIQVPCTVLDKITYLVSP